MKQPQFVRTYAEKLALQVMKTELGSSVLKAVVPKLLERIIIGPGYGGTDARAAVDQRAYQVHSWVFACVRVIAQNVAQIPFNLHKVISQDGKEETEQVPGHPIETLFRSPNPFMTAHRLKFTTLAHLELTGDAFWWLVPGPAGFPMWIVPLRPDRVRVIPSGPGGTILGYQYKIGSTEINIDEAEVIQFTYFNPFDDYRGQGTLEAARKTLNMDVDAKEFNSRVLRNDGTPKGALSYDQQLTKADYRRIRASWDQHHAGPDNAGKIAIFERGAKWTEISKGPRDMDYNEMLRMNRDELAAVFGVPPVLVNSYERATYNNADRQVAFFWHETLVPKTVEYEDTLTLNIHKFGSLVQPSEAGKLRVVGDLSDVWALRREQLDRTKTETEQLKWGRKTVNQLKAEANEEPVDWGDVWWRPQNLVPTSDASATQASAPPPPTPPPPTLPPDEDDEQRGARIIQIKDLQRERQAEVWKAFVINTDFFESRMATFVANIMRDQEAMMLRELRRIDGLLFEQVANFSGTETKRKPRASDIEVIAFDLEDAVEFSEEAATNLYERMATTGGRRGFDLAGVTSSFDLQDPIAQRHMLDKKQKFARKVNDTTWRRATRALETGIAEGETSAKVAERVQKVMGGRIEEAALIARTETVGTMNGGMLDGFAQSGVVKGKAWLTAGDEHVRSTHASTGAGEAIPLNEKFQVGNSRLEYPGDSNGEVGEIANCRCSMTAELIRS